MTNKMPAFLEKHAKRLREEREAKSKYSVLRAEVTQLVEQFETEAVSNIGKLNIWGIGNKAALRYATTRLAHALEE